MSAGAVDGARVIAGSAEKKCATPVVLLRERAVRRVVDGASRKRQRLDDRPLGGAEGDRPPGGAACA